MDFKSHQLISDKFLVTRVDHGMQGFRLGLRVGDRITHQPTDPKWAILCPNRCKIEQNPSNSSEKRSKSRDMTQKSSLARPQFAFEPPVRRELRSSEWPAGGTKADSSGGSREQQPPSLRQGGLGRNARPPENVDPEIVLSMQPSRMLSVDINGEAVKKKTSKRLSELNVTFSSNDIVLDSVQWGKQDRFQHLASQIIS